MSGVQEDMPFGKKGVKTDFTTPGRIVALVQARLGSSRLPGKMLLPLRGIPVIDWVMRRLSFSMLLSDVVLATTDTPGDDPLVLHAQKQGYATFRGSEDDVLERFRCAGKAAGAEYVVRVCADNPFIWGEAVDALIKQYFFLTGNSVAQKNRGSASDASLKDMKGMDGEQALDSRLYVYNHIPRQNLWPDGFGAEMVSYGLLERIARLATLPAQREHCFSYIWDTPELFSIRTFEPEDAALRRPDIKLDIDTAEDYEKLSRLPVTPESSGQEIIQAYSECFGGGPPQSLLPAGGGEASLYSPAK